MRVTIHARRRYTLPFFVVHASTGRTELSPTPTWKTRRSGDCWKGRGAMAAIEVACSGGDGGSGGSGGGGAAAVQVAR